MGAGDVHGVVLPHVAGAEATVAALPRRNAGFPVARGRSMACRFAYHQRGALMSFHSTAKANYAVSPAGTEDSKPTTGLLTSAWSMVRRWKGRIFFAVLDQGFASGANFLLTILCIVW